MCKVYKLIPHLSQSILGTLTDSFNETADEDTWIVIKAKSFVLRSTKDVINISQEWSTRTCFVG